MSVYNNYNSGQRKNPFFGQAALCGGLSGAMMALELLVFASQIIPRTVTEFAHSLPHMGMEGLAAFLFIVMVVFAAPYYISFPIIGMLAMWNCAHNAKRYGNLQGEEGRKIRQLNFAAPVLFVLSVVMFLLVLFQLFASLYSIL